MPPSLQISTYDTIPQQEDLHNLDTKKMQYEKKHEKKE
jgi:hypothetical protein